MYCASARWGKKGPSFFFFRLFHHLSLSGHVFATCFERARRHLVAALNRIKLCPFLSLCLCVYRRHRRRHRCRHHHRCHCQPLLLSFHRGKQIKNKIVERNHIHKHPKTASSRPHPWCKKGATNFPLSFFYMFHSKRCSSIPTVRCPSWAKLGVVSLVSEGFAKKVKKNVVGGWSCVSSSQHPQKTFQCVYVCVCGSDPAEGLGFLTQRFVMTYLQAS